MSKIFISVIMENYPIFTVATLTTAESFVYCRDNCWYLGFLKMCGRTETVRAPQKMHFICARKFHNDFGKMDERGRINNWPFTKIMLMELTNESG